MPPWSGLRQVPKPSEDEANCNVAIMKRGRKLLLDGGPQQHETINKPHLKDSYYGRAANEFDPRTKADNSGHRIGGPG